MNVGLFADCDRPTVSGVVTSLLQLQHGLEQRGHHVILFVPTTPVSRPSGWRNPAVPQSSGLRNLTTQRVVVHLRGMPQAIAEQSSGWHPFENPQAEPGVVRFPSLPFNRASGFRLGLVSPRDVRRLVRQHQLDIIHTHTEYSLGWAGQDAARHLGIPGVHTAHTLHQAYLHYLPLGSVLPAGLVGYYLRLFLSHCTALICPSAKARDCFQAFLPGLETVVIPNGIDPAEFCSRPVDHEQVAGTRQALGLRPTDRVLLYAGRVAPEKRVVELLGALVPLLQARPEVKLLLVGSGPAEWALAVAVESHGVEAQVIRAGRVEWPQMHHFYSVAHLFVTASLSEMQPMTLIESATCGLPVVARRDPAYAGLVRDGYNGYQVASDPDLADRVAELLQDEGKRQTFARQARIVAEAFSADSHVGQVESLYRQVMARSRAATG